MRECASKTKESLETIFHKKYLVTKNVWRKSHADPLVQKAFAVW